MRHIALIAVCSMMASSVCAAKGVLLAPGDVGSANGVGIGASESVLASNSGLFFEYVTDAGVGDRFVTSVAQMPSGELAFTYRLSAGELTDSVSVPASLTLSGFSGVSTDVYVLAGTGNESTDWGVSRSTDGATLKLSRVGGTVPSNPEVDVFTVEVRTDASGYVFNSDAYRPTYWTFPNAPPPALNLPTLGTFVAAGYSPNISAAAVPEPLAILTLPLALLAMAWRTRRGVAGAG